MNSILSVRPSPIAGSWYPSDPDQLSKEINGYLDKACLPSLQGEILGVISPHAGYYYSGATAGYAYRSVQGKHYNLCVVVSPLHNYLPNPLLTSAHSFYATPLGQVEVDQGLLSQFEQKMVTKNLPPIQPVVNDREHSLEIQLPFLQTALSGSFRLLPLMVRTLDAGMLKQTGEVLAELLKAENVLLVASTDLSHFYNESTANAFDRVMLKRMSDFSPSGVLEAEINEEGFACGSGAVALVLWTSKALGANQVTLLNHSTSAQASGDSSSVVGYGALAITRQEAN